MATIESENLISISDASKLGISALIREAEEGREWVVLRNKKAVAAVVSMERFERLQQLRDDLVDITLVASRMATTGPARYSLDDVLAHFGYTGEDLADTPE